MQKHLARATMLIAALGLIPAASAQKVEIVNNHAFPIRMPWVVRTSDQSVAGNLAGATQKTTDGYAIIVDVPANGTQVLKVSAGEGTGRTGADRASAAVTLVQQGDGIGITFGGKDLGRLSFAIVVQPAVKPTKGKEDLAGAGKPDLPFKPLSLQLAEDSKGPLFTTYAVEATEASLRITIEFDAYRGGFLDIRSRVVNEGAPRKDAYAAVLMKWDAEASSRTAGYDNHVLPLADNAATPWRVGEGRHHFVKRGLDWVASTYKGGSALLLNAFAPSFTYHKPTTRTPAQWIGANSAQLAQEAYTQNGALYCVTELAHPNIRSYRSRVQDNILPDASQPMVFTQRIVFSTVPITPEAADHTFVAYSGYNPQSVEKDGTIRVSFGVPYATFGSAYFPYSTLGENFITQRLPGMSQDTYWPLAADIVKHYQLFADDIRRDLRILKALGFDSDRLHHLELLWEKDAAGKEYLTAAERDAFLDFYFAELRHVGITALLDVKLPTAEIVRLVERYRPAVDGVEIDNEVLIFGIKDSDPQYWKDVYAAVKKVAPDMPVHLTAHTNTGAFMRLNELSVPYDRLGQHTYMDALDAIPSSLGFALQVASYATRMNKPPVITEWNWRGLTRMTEAARAAAYAPIFENVLEARCMPQVYQFQFNDSLAMNPEGLKGIRHYELINLSRRPKLEADVFAGLVEKYSAPESGPRTLKVARQVVEFAGGKASGELQLENISDKTLRVTPVMESGEGIEGTLASTSAIELAPRAMASIKFELQLKPQAAPGFYHSFVRLEDGEKRAVRYGWIEARNPGRPKLERLASSDVTYTGEPLEFDLNRPLAVVYGDHCPILELEAAWVVYQTLEAATGRPVAIYTLAELPKDGKEAVIYVGTPKSVPVLRDSRITDSGGQFVTRATIGDRDALLIGGGDSHKAALAAMDYTLCYWRFAKDAACRRVPLVAAGKFKGPDAGQLP